MRNQSIAVKLCAVLCFEVKPPFFLPHAPGRNQCFPRHPKLSCPCFFGAFGLFPGVLLPSRSSLCQSLKWVCPVRPLSPSHFLCLKVFIKLQKEYLVWRGIYFRILLCFFAFGFLASWLLGFLASWLLGFSASWLLGFLASWLLGFSASWLFGFSASGLFGFLALALSQFLSGLFGFCTLSLVCFPHHQHHQFLPI